MRTARSLRVPVAGAVTTKGSGSSLILMIPTPAVDRAMFGKDDRVTERCSIGSTTN